MSGIKKDNGSITRTSANELVFVSRADEVAKIGRASCRERV